MKIHDRHIKNDIQLLQDLEQRNLALLKEYQSISEIVSQKEAFIYKKESEILDIIEKKDKYFKNREKALKKLSEEKSYAFPWLAKAIAEYNEYFDLEISDFLEAKNHPAMKSADIVRHFAKKNKELRKMVKISSNFVNYYEELFPWLKDYVGEDLEDLLKEISEKQEIEEVDDPVLKFITKIEYHNLTEEDRNQKALDRYFSSRKKPWQIGRDYERFIGYQYEMEGYAVDYIGIEQGLEDLGRDLICKGKGEVLIIQCKYWNSRKTIHEKHINQLYGTAVKYYIDSQRSLEQKDTLSLFPEYFRNGIIKAMFITSTNLSVTAKDFAQALGVKIIERQPLDKYPVIKCNISANGDMIYHLPFDQQYDNMDRNDVNISPRRSKLTTSRRS